MKNGFFHRFARKHAFWALCLPLLPTAAGADGFKDYWKELALGEEYLFSYLNPVQCSENLPQFLGCVAATNSLLKVSEPPQMLDPRGGTRALEELPVPSGPEVSLAEMWNAIQANRKARIASYTEAFATNPKIFDFQAIARKSLPQISTAEKSLSYRIGNAVNEYLTTAVDPHTITMPVKEMDGEPVTGPSLPPQVPMGEVFVYDSNPTGGIGMDIGEFKGKFIVLSPLIESPSAKAGFRSRDEILEVGGVSVEGMSFDDLLDRIMGPVGTEITFKIRRGKRILPITAIREKKEYPKFRKTVVKSESGPMGYIRLDDFQIEKGCTLFKEAVFELERKEKVKGLIIDLRDNPGGYMNQMLCIAGLLMGKDPLIYGLKNIKSNTLRGIGSQYDQITMLPVIALINSGTASAAEVLAAALQDNNRGVLIGNRSFGKGSQQVVSNHPKVPGLYLLETTDLMMRPEGQFYQGTGIFPDLQVGVTRYPVGNDLFAQREEDAFANSIPSQSPPPPQKRPEFFKAVAGCVEREGKETKKFDDLHPGAGPSDYPLLYALDAAACMRKGF